MEDQQQISPDALKKLRGKHRALLLRQSCKADARLHQVVDRLFIGSVGCALNVAELKENGVTHNLLVSISVKQQALQAKVPDVTHSVVQVRDASDATVELLKALPACLDFIDRALSTENGSCLICSFRGMSRAYAVLCAYLMYRQGMSLKEANVVLVRARPSVAPNPGFGRALLALEKELCSPVPAEGSNEADAVATEGGCNTFIDINQAVKVVLSSLTEPQFKLASLSLESDGVEQLPLSTGLDELSAQLLSAECISLQEKLGDQERTSPKPSSFREKCTSYQEQFVDQTPEKTNSQDSSSRYSTSLDSSPLLLSDQTPEKTNSQDSSSRYAMVESNLPTQEALPYFSPTAMPGLLHDTVHQGYDYICPYVERAQPYVEAARRVPLVDPALKTAEKLLPTLITQADQIAQPQIDKMRPFVEPRIVQVKERVAPYVNRSRDEGVKIRKFAESKVGNIKVFTDPKVVKIKEFMNPTVEKTRKLIEPKMSFISNNKKKIERIFCVPASLDLQGLKYETLLGKLASWMEKMEAVVDRYKPLTEEQKKDNDSGFSNASDTSCVRIIRSVISIMTRPLALLTAPVVQVWSFPAQLKTSDIAGTLKSEVKDKVAATKAQIAVKTELIFTLVNEKLMPKVATLIQNSLFKKLAQLAITSSEQTFGEEKTMTILNKVDAYIPSEWKAGTPPAQQKEPESKTPANLSSTTNT